MKRKILYVDLDDVLADFTGAAKDAHGKVIEERMFNKNFFLNLTPIPGSKAGVFRLIKHGFDVWILSQPFVLVPESYIEKALWVQQHFPQLASKIILTQDKGLNTGHFLIDDNAMKWKDKFEKNGGKFIHFPYGGYNPDSNMGPELLWTGITEYLLSQNPLID